MHTAAAGFDSPEGQLEAAFEGLCPLQSATQDRLLTARTPAQGKSVVPYVLHP